jgi:hypothetical protein
MDRAAEGIKKPSGWFFYLQNTHPHGKIFFFHHPGTVSLSSIMIKEGRPEAREKGTR